MLGDWTFVEDIAQGVVAATDNPLGFQSLNLGRGQPQSLSRFIEVMESTVGDRVNLVPAIAPSTAMTTTFADISKARRLLGYNPTIDMEDGVNRYCNWFAGYHNEARPVTPLAQTNFLRRAA